MVYDCSEGGLRTREAVLKHFNLSEDPLESQHVSDHIDLEGNYAGNDNDGEKYEEQDINKIGFTRLGKSYNNPVDES